MLTAAGWECCRRSSHRAPAAAHTVRAPAALRHFPARFRGTFCAPQLSGERRGAAFWRVLNILYRISWCVFGARSICPAAQPPEPKALIPQRFPRPRSCFVPFTQSICRTNVCDSGLHCGRWGCSLSILVANIWRLPLSLVVYIQRGERKKDSLFHKSNKNIIKIQVFRPA